MLLGADRIIVSNEISRQLLIERYSISATAERQESRLQSGFGMPGKMRLMRFPLGSYS